MKKIILVTALALITNVYALTPTPTATATPAPEDTPTATATPASTPVATATPVPTETTAPASTPAPTATAKPSVKPTATAKPSAKPTATATPTPKSKLDECKNVKKVPTAVNDTFSGKPNEVTTVNAQKNDTAGDKKIEEKALRLLDASGKTTKTFYKDGQGSWIVDAESGNVLFDPDSSFTGSSSVAYYIVDTCGNPSNHATITISLGEEEKTKSADGSTPASTQTSDSGSASSTTSIVLLMIMTASIVLFFTRREELN